jgi:hypothetical protein
MAHFAWSHFDRAHLVRNFLDRVESAIVIGLIGTGLVACALAALVYDVENWLSAF